MTLFALPVEVNAGYPAVPVNLREHILLGNPDLITATFTVKVEAQKQPCPFPPCKVKFATKKNFKAHVSKHCHGCPVSTPAHASAAARQAHQASVVDHKQRTDLVFSAPAEDRVTFVLNVAYVARRSDIASEIMKRE